jgi:malic enzyme
MPLLGMGAAGLGISSILSKAHAGDLSGAGLDAAEMVDPTGIAGMANEAKKRLDNPEYAKEQAKEDRLNAMPVGMDLEAKAIADTEEPEEKPKKFKSLTDRLFGI